MAGNSALGGFVEGLQGGMKFRQDAKRAKKIDRMLDQEGRLQAMAITGKQNSINEARKLKGLDPMDFNQFDADPEPYDMKLTDFFKPKKLWQNFKDNMGIGAEVPPSMDTGTAPAQANQAAVDDITSGADASSLGVPGNTDDLGVAYSADGGPVRKMANGGSVSTEEQRIREARQRNMRARAAYADKVRAGGGNAPDRVTPRSSNTGSSQGGRLSKLNPRITAAGTRKALGWAARRAPGAGAAISTYDAIRDQQGADYDERMDERFGDWGWGEPGEASFGGAAEFGIKRALGFASDLGDALTLGQASRLYRDERDSFGLGPDEYVPEEKAQAIRVSDAVEPEPEQAPTAAQPAAAPASKGRTAEEIVAERTANAPNALADAPITDPGEMPTMNTEEWVAYRATKVENLLLQGYSLPEAHDAITTMQQKGFLNYGTQALQMLAAGDPARAAMALKAAYQYFPNGADVRFGITEDKGGQPALVAMGSNEVTGEPSGPPMLITGERLAVMMENMTDPAAFRTWTKDWREFEQELREYYEVTKPQAQSENQYRADMGAAALNRSEADLVSAISGGRGGGRKRTDIDRNSSALRTAVNEAGTFEGIAPAEQRYLSRIMEALYLNFDMTQNAAIDEVMAAYEAGALPELLESYGLSNVPEQGE